MNTTSTFRTWLRNLLLNNVTTTLVAVNTLFSTGCHFASHTSMQSSRVGGMVNRTVEVQTAEQSLNDAAIVQLRISGRVQDAKIVGTLGTMNTAQAYNMFQEASSMIDSRHLEPASDEKRNETGLRQLAAALGNADFRQRAGIRIQGSSLETVKQQLLTVAANFKVNNRRDSLQLLQYTTDYLQKTTGMNPVWTIYEYTNAIVESQDKYSSLMVGTQFTNKSVERTDVEEMKTASEPVVGIGVELKSEETGARVVRPLQGGPAELAGITRGDMILMVNGVSLKGMDLEQMASVIRGPVGSQLTLIVKHLDGTAQNMVVRRNQIEQKSVSEVRLLTGAEKVGYIKIDKFAADSKQLVEQGLWNLHNQGMKSLIVDVRGNPGGLLTSAIEISDLFLTQGTIVSTRGRDSRDNMQETAQYAQTWKVPLTVLVDGNSASASEIFAAAIQENKRGVIVGANSYGKGTVQTHFPMNTISGTIKLTTAKFYSPNGREMAGAGVKPDVLVQVDTNDVMVWSQDLILSRAMDMNTQNSSIQLVSYMK